MCPYKKGKCGHRGTHTGRAPCEDEGRLQSDDCLSKRMPKISSKPPEAKGEAWNRFSITAFRRNYRCQSIDLRFLVIITISTIGFTCLSHPVSGDLLQQFQ